MSVTRRDFVRQTTLAAAALAARPGLGLAWWAPRQGLDAQTKQLCMLALDAARAAGADYADARVMRFRRRIARVLGVDVAQRDDTESFGFAVRVLAGGKWGYATGEKLLRQEAFRLARAAVEQARASDAAGAVTLAPVSANPDGEWHTPIEVDPFSVPLDEQAALLVDANGEAMRISRVQRVESAIECQRIEMTFASTAGTVLEQVLHRTYPWMAVTAAEGAVGATRTSWEVPPLAVGYEYVSTADLVGNAGGWAEDVSEIVTARPVEAGEYDLILHPSHLARVLHETIGRPTQLDRVTAGSSYLSPPDAMIGKFRLGPEFLNVQGDRTQRDGLATVGWDDEGVPADAWPLVTDGVLVDYQTTRASAPTIAALTGIDRSHGCMVSESWELPPAPAMPNVSLLAGERDLALDDMIAATERGLLIKGAGPYRLDDRSDAFAFTGQLCYEVRDGAIAGMVRNAAYQGRSADLWNALDMLGGAGTYELGGILYDPAERTGAVSGAGHGAAAARFRGITVVRTGS